MDIREKLLELLGTNARCPKEVSNCHDCPYWTDDVGCYGDGATADMLIANGVTIQEWIPVSERLPETTCRNLVMTRHGIAVIAYYDGNVWRYSAILSVVDAVTHWMPIPQPPKGE